MTTKTEPTYWVRIYISGPQPIIEQTCREYCMMGLCVTVELTRFIYTGGEETGCVIGLINCPRFPTTEAKLWATALGLADMLLERTFQHSVLLMTPKETHWITKREDK